jgi:hypothetical protein
MFNPSNCVLFIFIEVFNNSIQNADRGAQSRGIGVLPSQAREGPHPSELDYLCDCYVPVHASCLISQCNFFNPSVTFQDFIFHIYFLVVTPSKITFQAHSFLVHPGDTWYIIVSIVWPC